MKFIVKPIEPKPTKGGGLNTTMCWLCSEDPRACY